MTNLNLTYNCHRNTEGTEGFTEKIHLLFSVPSVFLWLKTCFLLELGYIFHGVESLSSP